MNKIDSGGPISPLNKANIDNKSITEVGKLGMSHIIKADAKIHDGQTTSIGDALLHSSSPSAPDLSGKQFTRFDATEANGLTNTKSENKTLNEELKEVSGKIEALNIQKDRISGLLNKNPNDLRLKKTLLEVTQRLVDLSKTQMEIVDIKKQINLQFNSVVSNIKSFEETKNTTNTVTQGILLQKTHETQTSNITKGPERSNPKLNEILPRVPIVRPMKFSPATNNSQELTSKTATTVHSNTSSPQENVSEKESWNNRLKDLGTSLNVLNNLCKAENKYRFGIAGMPADKVAANEVHSKIIDLTIKVFDDLESFSKRNLESKEDQNKTFSLTFNGFLDTNKDNISNYRSIFNLDVGNQYKKQEFFKAAIRDLTLNKMIADFEKTIAPSPLKEGVVEMLKTIVASQKEINAQKELNTTDSKETEVKKKRLNSILGKKTEK